jgi:hypothetical protein
LGERALLTNRRDWIALDPPNEPARFAVMRDVEKIAGRPPEAGVAAKPAGAAIGGEKW